LKVMQMLRDDPNHLGDFDDQCAVHHFIRVHGRRPTRERCRQTLAQGTPSARGSSATHLAARAPWWLRREVVRFIDSI
jgi:hypothetical protein